jgi:hypothetical protein
MIIARQVEASTNRVSTMVINARPNLKKVENFKGEGPLNLVLGFLEKQNYKQIIENGQLGPLHTLLQCKNII